MTARSSCSGTMPTNCLPMSHNNGYRQPTEACTTIQKDNIKENPPSTSAAAPTTKKVSFALCNGYHDPQHNSKKSYTNARKQKNKKSKCDVPKLSKQNKIPSAPNGYVQIKQERFDPVPVKEESSDLDYCGAQEDGDQFDLGAQGPPRLPRLMALEVDPSMVKGIREDYLLQIKQPQTEEEEFTLKLLSMLTTCEFLTKENSLQLETGEPVQSPKRGIPVRPHAPLEEFLERQNAALEDFVLQHSGDTSLREKVALQKENEQLEDHIVNQQHVIEYLKVTHALLSLPSTLPEPDQEIKTKEAEIDQRPSY